MLLSVNLLINLVRLITHALIQNCVFIYLCSPACDDECSGLLISDLDRLYRIIVDVTLTTPLPPPYKALYRFENMTEELKVDNNYPCGNVYLFGILFFSLNNAGWNNSYWRKLWSFETICEEKNFNLHQPTTVFSYLGFV